MRKIAKLLWVFLTLWLVVVRYPRPVIAQFKTWSNCEIPNTVYEFYGEKIATIQGLECLFLFAFRIIVRLVGIAGFIMIIAGGFQYLTSGGNPENTKKAAGTITWGIAGLAILILSWFILKFIGIFTGVNVTNFTIPGP